MPTRRIMLASGATTIFIMAFAGVVRLWAARRSTEGGALGTLGDAINAAI